MSPEGRVVERSGKDLREVDLLVGSGGVLRHGGPDAVRRVLAPATGDAFVGMGENILSGPALNFGYAGLSIGRSAAFFNIRPDASAVAPNPSIRFMTANVERLIIDNEGFIGLGGVANPGSPIQHSNGALLTAGGAWQNGSSRALKQDISQLSPSEALAAVAGLQPVKFAYKAAPSEHHVGFIAEDVPDLVASTDRQSLGSMDIVAVLTKVVQEQQTTIEKLAARLAELEQAQKK